MKKLILTMLMALGLTIAIASNVSSQTPDSNTAPQPTATPATSTAGSTTVPADQTISFLLDQNDKARELITAQEARIKDLEAEVSAERENGASLGKSYKAAQSEIDSLKRANEALHKAVSVNEQTISLLQTDRDKWKDKAKKETRSKYKAYIVAGGLLLLKFLLP
jgi:peptidoglycan hydrolase CwlO-like protein